MRKDQTKLKALGVSAQRNKKSYQFSKPNKKLLETFDNKYPENETVVTFHSRDNLTSLCPITGQPDLCLNLWIQYIPMKKLVESKSLKLYLNGFRQYGCFHEEICNIILNDLWGVLDPLWIRVTADYASRGGLAIIPAVTRSQVGEVWKTRRDFTVPNAGLTPLVTLSKEYH